MHKGENTLLIWILSWSAILLALLYSPLGSPDLYKSIKYFNPNQGVNFNKTSVVSNLKSITSLQTPPPALKSNVGSIKSIKNAPKERSNNQDENLNIPVEKKTHRNGYNYSVSNTSKLMCQNSTAVAVQFKESARREVSQNESGYDENTQNSGSTHSTSHSESFSSSSINSFSHSKIDNSMFSDSTSLALASNQIERTQGFLDPGDGDPVGEPVPIPDGWGFLIIMALIYCGYILYKKNTVRFSIL